MDDTSDPCWSWPHWKFGLKRNDLFTKLHDQYNTVPSPILDPEAFHHDVYELSHQAATADEFHRLLQDRKQQRIRELNETLESAAFEIIANPSLIGTDQWHHAVQLFRTKSLDSLVRYFASYLPSDHPWYKSADSTSGSDVDSSVDSVTDSHPSLFDDDCPLMTDEPFDFSTSLDHLLPASPRSMTMCSDSSVASPIDDIHHDYDLPPLTPARTLSFSGSESELDCCDMSETHTHCGVPLSTIIHGVDDEIVAATHGETHSEKGVLPVPSPDTTESEMPTPKPEGQSASFFEDSSASLPHHRRYRSLSPSRPQPVSECDMDEVLIAHRDPRNQQRSRFRKERECSPVSRRRRSPVEPATRIQKPLSESARSRPRGRRLVEF